MEKVDIEKAQRSLGEVLEAAQRDEVVITRGGEPVALVIGLSGLDMEQVSAGLDDELWGSDHPEPEERCHGLGRAHPPPVRHGLAAWPTDAESRRR
jgi:prevent-host-death family protein